MRKKRKTDFKCLLYIYVCPISDKIVDLMGPIKMGFASKSPRSGGSNPILVIIFF